jgi:hypothetical protein
MFPALEISGVERCLPHRSAPPRERQWLSTVLKAMSMKPETEVKVKYGVWGLIIGSAGAMIIGFNWGGWTTKGTSQEMSEAALLTTRAAICVAQFTKGPNDQQRLKELKAVNSWERAAVIEKGGWDKMPGEEKASFTVARACADGLGVLLDK